MMSAHDDRDEAPPPTAPRPTDRPAPPPMEIVKKHIETPAPRQVEERYVCGSPSLKRHFINNTPEAITSAQAFAIVIGHAVVMTP